MANVQNGNLLIQADDVNVPERGINLAFRRTYNSMSHETVADPVHPAVYGNHWTNTFDAHLEYNGKTGVMSVYDIDGARYDYSSDGNGTWIHPPGQFASLSPDVPASNAAYSGDCGYWWTKKSGTAYFFQVAGVCPTNTATNFDALLGKIEARNHNNYLQLTYTFPPGQVGNLEALTSLAIKHQDGQTLVLAFGLVAGKYNELQQVQRPDYGSNPASVITYAYDANGNLATLTRPGNTLYPTVTAVYGPLAQANTYAVCSPRAESSNPTNPGNPTAGDCVRFDLNAYGQIMSWRDDGVVNINPNDGTGSNILQSSAQPGLQIFYERWFDYNVSEAGGVNCGSANIAAPSSATVTCDTDGHASLWDFDSFGRVVTVRQYSNPSRGTALVSHAGWDGAAWNGTAVLVNNLPTSSIDERTQETDYAYDNNGNETEIALPADATGKRPISTFSYQTIKVTLPSGTAETVNLNNITAYCDPIYNAGHGATWPPSGTSDLCPGTGAAPGAGLGYRYFRYTRPSYEPYGQLADSYTPCWQICADPGDHISITYSTASQGGTDYGLPTDIVASSYSQTNTTTTTVTPQKHYSYDALGRLKSSNNGVATTKYGYDVLNRVTDTVDPDTNSNGMGPLKSLIAYNPDGTPQCTDTPVQYASDSDTTCGIHARNMTYDQDGNELTETHHNGQTASNGVSASVSEKWYDGLDRLVEVCSAMPCASSTNALRAIAYFTRYDYDLSVGAGVSLPFVGRFLGHGGLYAIEQNAVWNGATEWVQTKGTAYDALDRTTTSYRWNVATTSTSVAATVTKYDGTTSTQGLISSNVDELGEDATFIYDGLGRTRQESFSGDGGVTPTEGFAYDLDGRVISRTAGNLSETLKYDADGRLTEKTETSSGAFTSPATMTYHYNPDGSRRQIGVSSAGFNAGNFIKYTYRTDGLGERLVTSPLLGGTPADFTWKDTAAGRLLSRQDVGTTSQTFDTYGRVESRGNPNWSKSWSKITYDLEGNRLSDQLEDSNYGAIPEQINYDALGEMTQSYGVMPPALSGSLLPLTPEKTSFSIFYAYQGGAPTSAGQGSCSASFPTGQHCSLGDTTYQPDPRYGAVLTSQQKRPRDHHGCSGVVNTAYAYDGAGRSVDSVESVNQQFWDTRVFPNACVSKIGTSEWIHTYDAKNRIVNSSYIDMGQLIGFARPAGDGNDGGQGTNALGPVVVNPTSLLFTSFSGYQDVTVTQSGYAGKFTVSGDCGNIVRITELKDSNGSAKYRIRPILDGACVAKFDGGKSLYGKLAISVTPYGGVMLSPSTLNGATVGSTYSLAVSQVNYTGAFSEKDSCSGLASISSTFDSGGAATYQITALAAGSCTAKFTGGNGYSASLPIVITASSSTPSPSPTPTVTSKSRCTFEYGPNNHPALVTCTGFAINQGTFSLHWDGDNLLFITDASGAVIQQNIGNLAVAVKYQKVAESFVYARDVSGKELGALPATYEWSTEGLIPLSSGTGANCQVQEQCLYVRMPSSDSIAITYGSNYPSTDSSTEFHGAREAENGQFLTPDWSDGSMGDPMTQRPYMLDNYDPVRYSDPSGFMAIDGMGAADGWGGLEQRADALLADNGNDLTTADAGRQISNTADSLRNVALQAAGIAVGLAHAASQIVTNENLSSVLGALVESGIFSINNDPNQFGSGNRNGLTPIDYSLRIDGNGIGLTSVTSGGAVNLSILGSTSGLAITELVSFSKGLGGGTALMTGTLVTFENGVVVQHLANPSGGFASYSVGISVGQAMIMRLFGRVYRCYDCMP
jgi:YD repeat-containing protein